MMSEKGRVLERLLSGHFICQTTDEEGYRFLMVDANAEAIESNLSLLNRTLTKVADNDVFFCAYQAIGDTERRHLTAQFKETANSLLPLVEWLVLVQEATGQNAPLSEGCVVRLNELQTIIEDTPAFTEQLAKISHYPLFNSSSNVVDAQLKLVFKRLTETGYLLRPNPDKLIYVATGKIDYVFEVIKFIGESENLALTEQAEDAIKQGELL
ncbi:hypothetical protein [Echinimonas agarilytica]|uniref:DUF4194 domain-containing protein n=1 Tax=Echinimonas agarilytica TaxID=1215918 RepID=A0AA41W6V0_9GAMM|nr:hypothetical protein [Echinimonas agarilytica]MCM2679588.1 hypothetical protein [Echinimonas agarilytica]